jgi:hypothetical protein
MDVAHITAVRSAPRSPNSSAFMISGNPRMLFRGVLSSWLIEARNSDFARLAKAALSRWLRSACCI